MGGIDYVSKPVLAEEVVVRIRIHLNRLHGGTAHRQPGAPVSRHPDEVIFKAAIDLIQVRLEALPSLPEIARMVGTYEKKLGQIFRERLSMTVAAFAAEERISLGRKLLVETDMSIQIIAEQVGFGISGNFATAFRKRMGMTPSVYRQALLEKGGELS